MKQNKFYITVIFLFFPFIAFAGQVKLTNVQTLSVHHQTRLIFSLSGFFKYRAFILSKPNRLVVDFPNTQLAASFKKLSLKVDSIKTIRTGKRKQNTLRIVFDLIKPQQVKAYVKKPEGHFGYRLVTDLIAPAKQAQEQKPQTLVSHIRAIVKKVIPKKKITISKKKIAAHKKTVTIPRVSNPVIKTLNSAVKSRNDVKQQKKPIVHKLKTTKTIAHQGKKIHPSLKVHQGKVIEAHKKIPIKKRSFTKKIIITHVKTKPLRNIIIVLDPGHGGMDPGATGQLGAHEKDVVLVISKDLYALLKKQKGVTPELTRHGDYFVALRSRLNLARKGRADFFIAIHADAYKNHYARGASVFALSERGATSEAARWLAQKENYSELMGGIDLADKSSTVRSVLINLSQTATIRESLIFGHFLIRSLDKVALLHHGSVEQAPFVVLKSPDIPSLLVEVGFISNRQEEIQLRSSVYQMKLAHALMTGIMNYLHRYAPRGTVLVEK